MVTVPALIVRMAISHTDDEYNAQYNDSMMFNIMTVSACLTTTMRSATTTTTKTTTTTTKTTSEWQTNHALGLGNEKWVS